MDAEGRCLLRRLDGSKRGLRPSPKTFWNCASKAFRKRLCLCIFAVIGCGQPSFLTSGDDLAVSSVGKAARLIYEFRIARRGAIPTDEAQLRDFAASMDSEYRTKLGLDSPDTYLISSRDGLPLILKLGKVAQPRKASAVVCYEREGLEGVRLVGKIGGDVEAADVARFAELVPAP